MVSLRLSTRLQSSHSVHTPVQLALPADRAEPRGRRLAACELEQYRDEPRLGRRTRLPERQRELLWSVFSKVAAALDEHGS